MGTAEGPKQEGEATAISSRDSNQPQKSYLDLKGFRFQIGGRSEADIHIFLDSCNKHKEDLKNIPDGKLRWANIAKSGAEASTDPENFTISHCLELGESIYFYTENHKEALKSDATFIHLCEQIKDVKEYLLTPFKNIPKKRQSGKMEKEILPENKTDEVIAVAIQHLNLFNIKGCDKAHVWREVSKKASIKNADKYLSDNIKSKIINELKSEEDSELKKEKFLKMADPIIKLFDFIAPRAIKVINFVPDFKQENEEMRKTNDPEPVIAEGPPEMILPDNVSATNHEETDTKIKRKSYDEKPEFIQIVDTEDELNVNDQPPTKKLRRKRSRELFINGWSDDDVLLFIDACIENKEKLIEGKGWTRWTSVAESCKHLSKNPDCFTSANCSALGLAFKNKFEKCKHLMEQEGREHWKNLYDKAQNVWNYLVDEKEIIVEGDPKSEVKEIVKRKRGRPFKIPKVEPDTTSQNDEKGTEMHKKQRKRQAFSKIKNDENPTKTAKVILQNIEIPSSSRKRPKSRLFGQRKKNNNEPPKRKQKDRVDSTTSIIVTDVRTLRPKKNRETPETSETNETDTETIEIQSIETPGPSNLKRKVRYLSNIPSNSENLDKPQKVNPENQRGMRHQETLPQNTPGISETNNTPRVMRHQETLPQNTPGISEMNRDPRIIGMRHQENLPQNTPGISEMNHTPRGMRHQENLPQNTPGISEMNHTPRGMRHQENLPQNTPGISEINRDPRISGMRHPENLPQNTPGISEHTPQVHQNRPNYQGMPVYPPRPMYPFDMRNQHFNMYPYQNYMNQPGPSTMPIHPPNQSFANVNSPDQMALVSSHRGNEEENWFKQYAQYDHWKFLQLLNHNNKLLKIEQEKVNNLSKIIDKLDILNRDS